MVISIEDARQSLNQPKPSTERRERLTHQPIPIPRLDLFAVIFEGTSDDTLEKGVGHLAGSSLAETDGNVVLAAHRDTFFRPLKEIRVGDIIEVETKSGSGRYVVRSSEVVGPE